MTGRARGVWSSNGNFPSWRSRSYHPPTLADWVLLTVPWIGRAIDSIISGIRNRCCLGLR